MAVMKMKRTTRPSIKSLPRDLLTDVLARVASGSVANLLNVQLSCKEPLEVGSDDYVLQHACMDSFCVAPWPVSDEASLFLKRCKESGNAEALFKQGVYDYFSSSSEAESGLEFLKTAAKKGHTEAIYVYGIVLLLSCERRQGLKFLSSLKNSKFRVQECRKRVKQIVWRLWAHNTINVLQLTRTCNCWNIWSVGWEEEDYGDTCSESCFWEREAALFCNSIRTTY